MNKIIYKITSRFPGFYKSILLSYSQIFFSNNLWFALLLLGVSFFDFWAGLAGVLAVLITNVGAYLMGFSKSNIQNGYYGFNSLLVGLGIGVYYSPSVEFYFILVCAAFLTLLLTLAFEGIIGKYGLPYLSISFLIAFWMISLAGRQFQNLEISERGILMYNELFNIGGHNLTNAYSWISNINLHKSIITYFNSLGAIFFQHNIIAGFLISLGLLFYSRIAFTLSLIGFFSAYLFYQFIGADISQLSNSYVGFNFILTAIALGGFFIVASRQSYFWVIILVPIISILISTTTVIFNIYQLSIYSLPFNIVVLVFLYILKFRERNFNHPQLVIAQHFSPEKNLYAQLNYSSRFSKMQYFPFELPVRDKWTVTQGHNGDITHRGDWQHAWDLEITDHKNFFYKGNGLVKENYFCYNKPILAPGDGWVIQIIDNIEDNQIGNVDLEHNWGNSIIIKHTEGLYSNLSHIRKDSFKVKIGDYVKKGDVIALCGNSGRSPQPHVHFQVQYLPYIGSQTADYPLMHFVERKNDNYSIHFFDKPKQNQIVSNILPTENLTEAFKFIPGQKLYFNFRNSKTDEIKEIEWDVLVDYYNNPYLYCPKTKAVAYYRNDGKVFMFTEFVGSQKSELFYFYLAFYRISLGYYKNLTLEDTLPLTLINSKPLMFIQDFIAPFIIIMKSKYIAKYIKKTEDFSKCIIKMETTAAFGIGKINIKQLVFDINFYNNIFEKISFEYKNIKYEFNQIEKHRTVDE